MKNVLHVIAILATMIIFIGSFYFATKTVGHPDQIGFVMIMCFSLALLLILLVLEERSPFWCWFAGLGFVFLIGAGTWCGLIYFQIIAA